MSCATMIDRLVRYDFQRWKDMIDLLKDTLHGTELENVF